MIKGLPLFKKSLLIFLLLQFSVIISEAKILYTAKEIFKTAAFDESSSVAIVLIYGYKGTPVCWENFCNFLAQDYGKKISVYICKYPSSGEVTIREIANQISQELDLEFAKRAVHVFLVCHSMGGLVAKNANLTDKRYLEGICYIATPHDGTDAALMELLLFNILPKSKKQKLHFKELMYDLLIGYPDSQQLRDRSFVVVGTKPYIPQPPDILIPGKVFAEATHRLMGIDNKNDGIVPRSSAQGRKNGPNITNGQRYAEFYLNHSELIQAKQVYQKIFRDFFRLSEVIVKIRPYQKLPTIQDGCFLDDNFQKVWRLFTSYRIIQEILSDPESGIEFRVKKQNNGYEIEAGVNMRYRPEKEVGRYLEVIELFRQLSFLRKIPNTYLILTGYCFHEELIVKAQELAQELEPCEENLWESEKYLTQNGKKISSKTLKNTSGLALTFKFPKKVDCILLVIVYSLDNPPRKYFEIKKLNGYIASLSLFQNRIVPKGRYLVTGFHLRKLPSYAGVKVSIDVAWPNFDEIIVIE